MHHSGFLNTWTPEPPWLSKHSVEAQMIQKIILFLKQDSAWLP